jgi:hypothetical protein
MFKLLDVVGMVQNVSEPVNVVKGIPIQADGSPSVAAANRRQQVGGLERA